MKNDFYETNVDTVWYVLCAFTILIGLFVNVDYGYLVILLIMIHFYIVLGYVTSNLERFDRLGATFVGFLLHLFCYKLIIVFVSFIIDTEEIKESNSYEVKFLENEKIVISKDNTIEIISDSKLYWECRAKNCKNIIMTTVTEKPVNSIYSKDLFLKTSTIYSVD